MAKEVIEPLRYDGTMDSLLFEAVVGTVNNFAQLIVLYLGVKTIWYLHIHFVCARLLAWFAKKITLLFVKHSDLNITIVIKGG